MFSTIPDFCFFFLGYRKCLCIWNNLKLCPYKLLPKVLLPIFILILQNVCIRINWIPLKHLLNHHVGKSTNCQIKIKFSSWKIKKKTKSIKILKTLNLLKIKNLWKKLHTQLILNNKTHCKIKFHLTLKVFVEQIQKPLLE